MLAFQHAKPIGFWFSFHTISHDVIGRNLVFLLGVVYIIVCFNLVYLQRRIVEENRVLHLAEDLLTEDSFITLFRVMDPKGKNTILASHLGPFLEMEYATTQDVD